MLCFMRRGVCSCICVKWLTYLYAMTHSYVGHDSFLRVTWLVHALLHAKKSMSMHICAMTHWYMCHDSFTHVWHDSYMPCFMRREICWCEEESFHAYCAMAHSYVCHDSFVREPWLIRTCAMTRSFVWPDSYMRYFMRRGVCSCMLCHDPFIRVPWLIHMWAMTYSYMWHDSYKPYFISVHACFAMTHLFMWQDSFIFWPWLIHTCDMARIYPEWSCLIHIAHFKCAMYSFVWHTFTRVPSIQTCEIHLYVTHINESCPTYEDIYMFFPCASHLAVLIPSSGHGRLFCTHWVKGLFWVFLFSRHVLPFPPK